MLLENILSSQQLLTFAGFLCGGYVCFHILLQMLPRRLRRDNLSQKEALIAKAQKRREQVLQEAQRRFEHKLNTLREEAEESMNDEMQDLKLTEEELNLQEESLKQTEQRIEREEKDLDGARQKVKALENKLAEEERNLADVNRQLIQKLESLADVKSEDVFKSIVDNKIGGRQLESQKALKELIDETEIHSKKLAERSLARTLSRYEPKFYWPKSTSHVEVTDMKIIDALASDKYPILAQLKELTEAVDVELSKDEETHQTIVKLGGGYGIYKEAAKLTLEELLPKGPNVWGKTAQVYAKHRTTLERQALKLGQQAIRDLGIKPMHDEILKMVGALNWRTSYRQNQYYHSVEVSRLAGMLANEMGVDAEAAKRCGLLHDIGKSIDYRIEGSHAVISGDYADRFGEKRMICDTVMSHHNDLLVETPLAYILRTADTLSGARPGARVNLEEGYQIRLSAIDQAVRSFHGITKVAIMSGGREVHIEVNHKRVREEEIENLTKAIARKIEEEVAFPGQIKILVSRRFEATAVA